MAARPYTFSFNLSELFTLLVAVLATSFLVFLCGLYVGKRVQERRSMQEERTVRLPVTVTPKAEEGEPKESDLSFFTGSSKPKTDLSEASVRGAKPSGPDRRLELSEALVSERKRAVLAEGKELFPARTELPGVRWSVQVETTPNKAVASTVVQRLRAEGYEAYTVKVERQGEAWYRVRVGRFASLAEASSTAARLRREGKAMQAFVVSE